MDSDESLIEDIDGGVNSFVGGVVDDGMNGIVSVDGVSLINSGESVVNGAVIDSVAGAGVVNDDVVSRAVRCC